MAKNTQFLFPSDNFVVLRHWGSESGVVKCWAVYGLAWVLVCTAASSPSITHPWYCTNPCWRYCTFGPLTSEESPLCRSLHAFILVKTLHREKSEHTKVHIFTHIQAYPIYIAWALSSWNQLFFLLNHQIFSSCNQRFAKRIPLRNWNCTASMWSQPSILGCWV